MGYREDIFIDKNQLDIEWEKQSSLFFKYAEEHTNALAKRDRLKNELEVVKAEVFADIKKNWKEYEFTKKPTDGEARNEVEINIDVQEINAELIEANKEVNILASAKAALEHKKKALESLTSLWIQGWFADPKEGILNKGFQNEILQRQNRRSLKDSPKLNNLKNKRKKVNG